MRPSARASLCTGTPQSSARVVRNHEGERALGVEFIAGLLISAFLFILLLLAGRCDASGPPGLRVFLWSAEQNQTM